MTRPVSTPILLMKLIQLPFLYGAWRCERGSDCEQAKRAPSLSCFICTVGIALPSSDGHPESNEIKRVTASAEYSHTQTATAPKQKRRGQPEEEREAFIAFGALLHIMVDWLRKSCGAWNSCSGSCGIACDPGAVPGAPETPASEKLWGPPRES